MKRYISAALIPCLLLQMYGCYSLKPVGNDDKIDTYLKGSKQNIKFIFKNGNEITSQLENCERVSNNKFVIYGTGTLIDKKTNRDKIFRGQLNETSIDSLKRGTVNSENYLICWLKDSARVSFKQNEFYTFNLNPDSSYWIIKNLKSPQFFNINDVKEIQVDKLDMVPTVIFGTLGIGILVSLIVLFANLPSGFNLNGL